MSCKMPLKNNSSPTAGIIANKTILNRKPEKLLVINPS